MGFRRWRTGSLRGHTISAKVVARPYQEKGIIMNDVMMSEWNAAPLTKTVRITLEEGAFPTYSNEKWDAFLEDTRKDGRFLAYLTYPALSMALEMSCANGDEYTTASDEENGIYLDFEVGYKYGEGVDDWASHGFVAADGIFPNVDFLSPTWEQDLKEEMQKVLTEYAEKNGLSFDNVEINSKQITL